MADNNNNIDSGMESESVSFMSQLPGFLIKLIIGVVFWGVISGLIILFSAPLLENLDSNISIIIRVIIVLCCVVMSIFGMNYSIRGVGKFHYKFGTKGWALKFLLVLILFILPFFPTLIMLQTGYYSNDISIPIMLGVAGFFLSWTTGRGIVKSRTGKLIIVE